MSTTKDPSSAKNGSKVCDSCGKPIFCREVWVLFDHQQQKELYFHAECYRAVLDGIGTVFH